MDVGVVMGLDCCCSALKKLEQSFVDLLVLSSLQMNCDPSQWDIPAFLPEHGTPPDQLVRGSSNRIKNIILFIQAFKI